MNLEEKINALNKCGKVINDLINKKENLLIKSLKINIDEILKNSFCKNGWFDSNNVLFMLTQIKSILNKKTLFNWIYPYKIKNKTRKNVGLILAGNIPLVGFSDILCVLITGHNAIIKTSSKDNFLTPLLIKILIKIEPRFKKFITIEEKLTNIDAIIATGSKNSSLYFDYYFGKYPHIFRKQRTSVAMLSGLETKKEIEKLANDIFLYYGLGCRSVSKIFVPKSFNISFFIENIICWSNIINNNKYANNYLYNRNIYLLNQEKILDNNFVILKESSELHSPIGVLYYEKYESKKQVFEKIKQNKDQIQCVVGEKNIPFGESQKPSLNTYADNIDTINFLLGI